MKKAVAFVMAMATTISLLAGCGSQGGSTESGSASSEKVTITIYQSKIEANEGYKKAIETYQTLHPEVTINLEAVTGNDFSASRRFRTCASRHNGYVHYGGRKGACHSALYGRVRFCSQQADV